MIWRLIESAIKTKALWLRDKSNVKFCFKETKMLTKKVLLVCLEAAVIVGIIGCAPTIVSTDAGVYQNGTLYASAGRDLDSVYSATLFAMDKLQLKVNDKMKDVFAAKVIAKTADGKIIVVKMEPLSENKTDYEIHVGAFGDEEKSRKIFSEIGVGLTTVKTK